ncbi:hypothetical protein [Clostridium sp.]|uniref:hypothetical protein n=1 Tax=Clostridium sp. TaxID=1506 RepID=UPI002847CABB|nr:hypothetical protein [Clostridium sp.]MDR3597891.1 hypothetical protein [Clostridium sp.]
MNNKFQNGKIYAIRSPSSDKYYIGSTTQLLCNRLAGHRQKHRMYVSNPNSSSYYSSYEILNFNDGYIELLENYPCNSREELQRKEGELIIKYKNDIVNKTIAGRNVKDWIKEHKEEIAEKHKQYYINHKNELLLKNKKYRETNKEEINKQRKLYRIENKEAIKQHANTNLLCECGGQYTCANRARHFKSVMHVIFTKV